jgi:hypothetical protein
MKIETFEEQCSQRTISARGGGAPGDPRKGSRLVPVRASGIRETDLPAACTRCLQGSETVCRRALSSALTIRSICSSSIASTVSAGGDGPCVFWASGRHFPRPWLRRPRRAGFLGGNFGTGYARGLPGCGAPSGFTPTCSSSRPGDDSFGQR